jgi:hypothetical protein
VGLFGGPSAEKILAKGSPLPGRIVGIEVAHVSDGDTTRLQHEYAVEVTGAGTLGIRQRLDPDEHLRLGMEVVVVVHDGAGVIDWAATGQRGRFPATTELHRHKALKGAPAPGIVDHDPAVASARKKGEPASISITALDERSVLGGLAQTLQATVTVVIDGTEPYQAEVKQVVVPGYASHLLEVGRTLPGFVSLRRLDKPVIDWAAAANAEPGLGVGPARPQRAPVPEEVASTPLDDGQGVRAAVDAAASDGQRIGGIDLATYVAVEVGLQRDRVRPDGHDAYAASLGVPPGTWAQASAAWQAAIRSDWKLGAAFGEAFEAARKRR